MLIYQPNFGATISTWLVLASAASLIGGEVCTCTSGAPGGDMGAANLCSCEVDFTPPPSFVTHNRHG